MRAFPNKSENTPEHEYYDGMELRDYFAIRALQALLQTKEANKHSLRRITRSAYGWADAMMEARDA